MAPSALTWINFFTSVLIECILYISFLLTINKIFLSVIILAFGNTMGDLFSSLALTREGENLMAFLSIFSGQIFNIFLAFSLNLFSFF